MFTYSLMLGPLLLNVQTLSIQHCAYPEIQLRNGTTWDITQDESAVNTMRDGCYRQYGDTAPCPVLVIKVQEQTYRVICGQSK